MWPHNFFVHFAPNQSKKDISSLNPISLNDIKVPDMKCPSHLLSRVDVIKPTQLKMPISSCHQRLPFQDSIGLYAFPSQRILLIVDSISYISFATLCWYLGLLIFENQLPFLITLNTWFVEQPHLSIKELGLAKERTEVKASFGEGFGWQWMSCT